MESIDAAQRQIVEEFAAFDDWMDKYAYLIDLGKELEPLPDEHRVASNLIEGCQSKVWIRADYEQGRVRFRGESDAILTRGLVSLLIRAYDGHTPDEILANEPRFIAEIGLADHLSPTRSNGLNAMIKQLKLYAMAFKAKHEA